MKKIILFSLSFFLIFLLGNAQDAFHTQLQSYLQSTYGLPVGTWVLDDTESDVMGNAASYGATSSVISVTGQDFSLMTRNIIASTGNSPFDAGWNIRNTAALQQGDIVLFTLYLRSEGGKGKVNVFVEDAVTYAKEVILTMPVDTQWRQYFIPFEAQNSYAVNAMALGLHLAFQAQTIEVAGFNALNYGKNAALTDLPNQINNQYYDGWEPTAPWRAQAATQIDQLRKANLDIQVRKANGDPVPNAQVQVKMLQHDFAFGSAVTADRIAGNNAYNMVYEHKIANLDGKGHGFNWAVFENDLKWPAWEDEWFVNKTELKRAIDWLKDQNIKLRGHALLWPGSTNLPNDVANNLNDVNFVNSRIDGHLNAILNHPTIKGNMEEWDVLNETVTNDDIENAFRGKPGYPTGREVLAEVFDKTQQIDSTIGLWINDYMTLSLQNEPTAGQYIQLKRNIQELVDADVGLDGIGFQAHLGGFPNGIPSVLATLDDFHQSFGLKAKITEFDLPSFVDEQVAATYMRDFMTAIFGHPSIDGFLFWNFWDGATWRNGGTNLFRMDWSMTPCGDTFTDLLFNEWWTDALVPTDANGNGQIRAFKGLHEISYLCDGNWVRDTLYLTSDATYQITCEKVSTGLLNAQTFDWDIYPNPASSQIHLSRRDRTPASISLESTSGQQLLSFDATQRNEVLDISTLSPGIYVLKVVTPKGRFVEKIIVQ